MLNQNEMTEQERHKKAQMFKEMYEQVNSKESMFGSQTIGDWKLVDSVNDKNTNFKAYTYVNEKTKEVAVFNIGTDFKNVKDIKDDIKMGFGKTTSQMKKAASYHDEMSKKYAGYKMNSIGHSEGGSESQFVGIKFPNTDVYTFNAYGIGRNKDLKQERELEHPNIYNYRDEFDPVSKLGKNLGNEYFVPLNDGTKRKPSVFGYKEAHQIKNMGDINGAVPAVEYKKKSKNVVDDVSNVLFTREDIAQMDGFTYDVLSPIIDKQLSEQSIMPREEMDRQAVHGNNIIYVSSYFRDDGTKVSGYYRRA